jgi:hypothetical protein
MILFLKKLIWKYRLRKLDKKENLKTNWILKKRSYHKEKIQVEEIDYSKLFNGNITVEKGRR